MAKAYINILSILAGAEDQYIDTHLETRAPDRTRNLDPPARDQLEQLVDREPARGVGADRCHLATSFL